MDDSRGGLNAPAGWLVFVCMLVWLICAMGFTIAGSTPPDALLLVIALTFVLVLACLVYIDRDAPRSALPGQGLPENPEPGEGVQHHQGEEGKLGD